MYGLIGLLGLGLVVGLSCLANSAGRWAAIRALGVRGAPFTMRRATWEWMTESPLPMLGTILAGGAGTYLLSSAVIAAGLVASGMDIADPSSTRVGVVAGGGADRAGLRDGDRVVAIDGASVADWPAIQQALRSSERSTVRVDLERNGTPATVFAERTDGQIQVRPPRKHEDVTLATAARVGFVATGQILSEWSPFGSRSNGEVIAPAPDSAIRRFGQWLTFVGTLCAWCLRWSLVYGAVVAPRPRSAGKRKRSR